MELDLEDKDYGGQGSSAGTRKAICGVLGTTVRGPTKRKLRQRRGRFRAKSREAALR